MHGQGECLLENHECTTGGQCWGAGGQGADLKALVGPLPARAQSQICHAAGGCLATQGRRHWEHPTPMCIDSGGSGETPGCQLPD